MALGRTINSNGDLKIQIPWKTIVTIVLAVIGGGGGLAAVKGVYGDSLSSKSDAPVITPAFMQENESSHASIRQELLETKTEMLRVKQTVEEIQKTQYLQIARTEARRLTEDIQKREKREMEYDRLVALNLSRLNKGQNLCSAIACE